MRKKVKIEKPIKFWCAVGIVKQDAFHDDGSVYQLDVEHPVGEQHIVYQGVLMCRSSRETLKNKLKAKKHKEVTVRIEGVKMCPRCEKKYKENANLPWQKWVQATPTLHGVK